MGITQSFMLAIKGLATSKMRAFLTMLGIIIGVGAVIIIMSLGNGMQKSMQDKFASMGTNTLTVTLKGRGSTRSISVDEMYKLAEDNKNVIKYMSPTISTSASVKYGNKTYTPTITGVSEDYLDIKDWDLTEGRTLQYIDIARRQPVCVVGAYYASEVFEGDALGEKIKINGNLYTVVGVIKETDDATDEDGSDNMVLIPYTNASKISQNAMISSYTFVAKSDETVSKAKTVIETRLYKAYADTDAYRVISMSEMLSTLTDLMNTMVLVLACIAGISLLVGGIGIMNIMLVSVTERTREIGIRKALGAKRRDIRGQFIIEAGTTSALGGILGIVFGVGVAQVVGKMIDMTAIPTFESIILSFGVSVGIGIIFGFLPANKAAKLNPIDALRYD
jgi:ABC-type antimicrobial peptide transport system, permease component